MVGDVGKILPIYRGVLVVPVTSLVVGPPGCGKTRRVSALVREAVASGRAPLVTSLTKAAAREAAGRGMPLEDSQIGTLHAHAFRQLGLPPLAAGAAIKDWNQAHPEWELTGGAVDADAPFDDGPAGDTMGDKLSAAYHLRRARMTPREEWSSGVVRFAEDWESWKQEAGLLDFSDVIEQARDLGPPGEADVIYVDEAQDHSRLELELLRAWAEHAGSLVLFGDPWQALYTWRGAHPAMFDGVRDREILSQSFRVPRAVHGLACSWIRELSTWESIEYRPRPEEGSAALLDACWQDPDPIVSLAEEHIEAGRTVMVMATCDYMLFPVLGVLRSRGLPFAQPWRLKHGGWNPLRGGTGTTMAERLLSLVKPVECAESVRNITDSIRGFCNKGQDLQSEARAIPGTASVPGSREALDDSFDFGANVADDDAALDAEFGIPSERIWSPSDVARWAVVMRAKGIIRHGMKKDMEAVLAETRETAVSTTLMAQHDFDCWFESEPAAFLAGVLRGNVERDALIAWWLECLLPPKQQAARFPCSVLRRRGRQALTDEPRLYIGNIHSFKGAEADVVILCPDLSGKGWRGWNESVEGKDSVVRQVYVGLTRARESVFVCRPAGSECASVWEWLN